MVWPEQPGHLAPAAEALLADRARQVLWLAQSHDEEEAATLHPAACMNTWVISMRLLGGGVCGPQWLAASCRAGKLLPALCSLKPALATRRTLCFHKSLLGDQCPDQVAEMDGVPQVEEGQAQNLSDFDVRRHHDEAKKEDPEKQRRAHNS